MPTTVRKKSPAKHRYRVIGVMSGSSLDGVDLALCTLVKERGRWSFSITKATTIPYPPIMRSLLLDTMGSNAYRLAAMDVHLGEFIGKVCKSFAGNKADLIASHGHTVFHFPRAALTTQIGSGSSIAAISGITTVCDFRTKDVALGGQGAPLVPLGEKLLFPGHRAFINIGGICNIAMHQKDRTIGYDVCIGNLALDHLAEEADVPFDRNGAIAAAGKVDVTLLERLNALSFHQQKPPRSIGREWFITEVRPLIADDHIPLTDRMRTVVEHIAWQLGQALRGTRKPVLLTGGGAHNGFLVERMRANTRIPIHVPDRMVVDYKEALVFALLGVLRMRGEVNVLASVTGAKRDSVGGAVYLPN